MRGASEPAERPRLPLGETTSGQRVQPSRMYRAILPNGQLECESYRKGDYGVELYNGDEELLAFVPYANLEALLTDAATETAGRSVM